MDECGSDYAGTSTAESNSTAETSSSTGVETGNTSTSFSETTSNMDFGSSGASESYESNGGSNIVETSPCASQELAETAHTETKQSMITEYGMYMSNDQLEMLKSDETKEHLNVMSSETYIETFPKADLNVIGHCDSEGNIYMKDISPEVVEHVSTHETIHLCANRESYTAEDGTKVVVSGLRESRVSENGSIKDMNRGANEGFTELYTMRELENREKTESAYSIKAYSESRQWAERIEQLVGSDKTAAAYFGNEREAMENEFNRLNDNNSSAWESFSKDIDTLEYSKNPKEMDEARSRLAKQYNTMVCNKYKS